MANISRAGLTDEYLMAVGEMTMLWGRLELLTEIIIMILGKVVRDAGPSIVGRQSMRAKLIIINRLVEEGVVKSDRACTQLKKLTNAIDSTTNRRNYVTHGNLTLNQESGKIEPFLYKHRASHKEKMKNFDLNQLVHDLADAVELASQSIVIAAQHEDPQPPSSPDKGS